ncbi:metallophosphoesterase [candidate division KSB1 bacterium]|nr:metallophosphoesterase [candidate division KSB1 bacterium]
MSKLAWLTDIHLDFLNLAEIQAFAEEALESEPDAFLVGGDISIAPLLRTHLLLLDHYWQRPLYFVLGNHDYYRGSVDAIRRELPAFLQQHPNLKWLPSEGVVALSPATALIGHGLWADGRLGLAEKSAIRLSDYVLIEELKDKAQKELYQTLNELGDRAALEFEPILRAAAKKYEHIYALTHIAPFTEASWHKHQISDSQFLPHFSCHAVGEMIRRVMSDHPATLLTILCGHTHSEGEVWITDNIFVKTGKARYGSPQVQEILHIEVE